MDPCLSPEVDFRPVQSALRERIVERERMARHQAARDVRLARECRRLQTEPVVRDRDECGVRSGGRRREQQRHPIDDERLGHAPHEPFTESQKIEIAVEIAGESDEGTAIVVPIAVVHAIERGLNRVLQGAREQNDDDRGEQRDDGILLILAMQEEPARDPE